jgi:hypothetical protein
VFVSCSNEARHLDDIIYGVDVLRSRGVDSADILVFVDHPTPAAHLDPYGVANVFPAAELGTRLAQSTPHASVVLIVTGHGCEIGLGDGSQLRPANLCSAARSVPDARICVLMMGQCFAGIFNFVDCYGTPPLIVIGGTNLNLSVSLPLNLKHPVLQTNGKVGLANWSANLFAFHFLGWIRSPIDIDGDGALTLLDAYRYAGAVSNGQLRQFKALVFRQAHAQERALSEAEGQLHSVQAVIQAAGGQALPTQLQEAATLKLKIKALSTSLQNTLEGLHLHQEPFLLNANVARTVHLSGFSQAYVPPSP